MESQQGYINDDDVYNDVNNCNIDNLVQGLLVYNPVHKCAAPTDTSYDDSQEGRHPGDIIG